MDCNNFYNFHTIIEVIYDISLRLHEPVLYDVLDI
ncbi:MAG: hypothetical protein MOP50_1148 [Nitrososphaera sp.]|nr:hypothetical protein [Nitrososphaera sp.]MCY1156003.1 hypothetical protein [Nitrososphaera sp.]